MVRSTSLMSGRCFFFCTNGIDSCPKDTWTWQLLDYLSRSASDLTLVDTVTMLRSYNGLVHSTFPREICLPDGRQGFDSHTEYDDVL